MESLRIIFEIQTNVKANKDEIKDKLNESLKDVVIDGVPSFPPDENHGYIHCLADELTLNLEIDLTHIKQIYTIYNELKKLTGHYMYVTCQNHHKYNVTSKIYDRLGLEYYIKRVKDKTSLS